MATKKTHGSERVAAAVMKDPVTREAVRHAGKESSSEVRASEARQSETRKRTEGQRETSMVWETTQKGIALVVTRATILTAATAALVGKWLGLEASVQMAAFVFLYGVANLVIGFYFGRTNHQRVGGPGGDQAGSR